MLPSLRLFTFIALFLYGALLRAESTPVDFTKDVLPLLNKNCLACHSVSKAKGDLILETPAAMRKGGENGPAVLPGKSAESMLVKMSAKELKPFMPPPKNKVGAVPWTSDELKVVKLWIDQGAKEKPAGAAAGAPVTALTPAMPIKWQPLPTGMNPIHAVAISPDGQYAICSRANQLFVYQLPGNRLITLLTDPALEKIGGGADRDLVQALAFHPDGTLLASAGYRAVKLWRRKPLAPAADLNVPGVQCAVASADGKWIAAGSGDGKIRVFETAKNALVKEISAHTGAVASIKFSPDNTKLCSGSADKTIRLWSIPSGDAAGKIDAPSEILAVTWAFDGKQIVSGGSDNLIRLWQPAVKPDEPWTGKEIKGHTGAVTALETFSAEGKKVLSGSADGSVQIWSLENLKSSRKLDHGGPVSAVAVRADGKRVASAGLNKVVKIWNAEDGKQLFALQGDRTTQEAVVAIEREFAYYKEEAAYQKKTLEAAEKAQKTEAETAKKTTDTRVAADKTQTEKQDALTKARAARDEAGKTFAEPLAALKKLSDEKENAEKALTTATAEQKAAKEKAAPAKAALAKAEEASAAAEKAATAAKDDKAIAEKASAAKAALEKATAAKAEADKPRNEADGKLKIATDAKAAAEKALTDATAKAKEPTEKIKTLDKALADAEQAFQQAERAQDVAEQNQEGAARALKKTEQLIEESKKAHAFSETSTKELEANLEAAKKAAVDSEKPLRSVAFSPDKLVIAVGGEDKIVHTYNVETGRGAEQYRGNGETVLSTFFLTDGRLVTASADQHVRLWPASGEWKLERVIGTGDDKSPLADRVLALEFSPDGTLLATGGGVPSRSGELKLWKTSDGTLARDFKDAHSDTIFAISFSASGKLIATGAADKLVKIFDVESGKLLRPCEGHTHHVLGVSWKRDARTLASCGADNVIKIWDLVTGEQKKTIDGFKKDITSIHYLDSRSELLMTAGNSEVRILKEDGGRDGGIARQLSGTKDFMQAAAITPDTKTVIAGGDDSVLRVWDGVTGKSMANFDPPNKPAEPAPAAPPVAPAKTEAKAK